MDSNPAISRILEPRPTTGSASPASGSELALNDALVSSLRVSDGSIPTISATAIPQTVLEPKPSGFVGPPAAGSTPRLRSSIACTRCRKSKIKCTNAGAGTTCEACAHSGRECVYPVPGTSGVKRDGEGEDGDRAKRTRVRKPDPVQGGTKVGFAPNYASPDHTRIRFGSDNEYSQLPVKSSALHPSTLGESTWNEVFHLFQLHYGTELSFLHSPTFLPQLTDSSVADSSGLQLLQLGILMLTARYHDGLVRQYSSQTMNGSPVLYKLPGAVSEYFAETLKSVLLNGDRAPGTCLEQPSLAKIQAFLMLALYEWSCRRGLPAWLYLGVAIRMAQGMELLSEDLDTLDIMSMSLTGLSNSTISGVPSVPRHDLESSETFVQEETARRTVWSCFLLDRYLSHGISRPITVTPEKVHVQMPCSEKAWTFGERVCTPFFNGVCSQHRDRTKRKLEHSRKKDDDKGSIDPRVTYAEVESLTNRIVCEHGQDEGLISRYIKLVDIWGAIAQWSYEGGKSSGTYAPWDDRSRYFTLSGELQKFMEQMPRSYRFTKANSQAHLTQHTWPSYTLLHTLYSICRLVLLREFLPFAPTKVESPTHLDAIEIREPNPYNQKWYSNNTLAELFKVANDFLELLQICKSRSSFPAGPMMGFGVYLVSLIGIYSLHFPQMDAKGLVFGKDLEPLAMQERQNRIIETIQILASLRSHLPMADHLFRTLHRAHRFYRQLNTQRSSSQPYQPNPSTYPPDRISPSTEPIRRTYPLDTLFQDLGLAEDETTIFALPKDEPLQTTNGTTERIPSPQLAWKPVNSPQPTQRYIDPLDRPAPKLGPQPHAKWYQQRGDAPRKTSPAYDQPLTYAATPPNTLPPINAPDVRSHSYPPTPPSVPSLKSGQTQMLLSFSGEDLVVFLDARDDKELAWMKAGWGPANNLGSQAHKRMEAARSAWFGLLWQWSLGERAVGAY